MAHRLQKRKLADETPQLQANQRPKQQQKRTSKHIPRPIHPSIQQIPEHSTLAITNTNLAFPPPGSLYLSQNTYNAGPDFCRPTSGVMESGTKKFQFPLGVWITPFGSNQVHSVKLQSPLRCQRCKAYVNPHFKHDGPNRSAVCNICGVKFGVGENIDKNNIYATQISTEGVIDLIVSDKFYYRKKMDMIKVIIALEMSQGMIQNGIFGNVIDSIKSSIESSQFERNIRFGVVYFNDEGVNFLKEKKSISQNEQSEKSKMQFIEYQANTKIGSYCCPLSDQEFLYNPNQQTQKQKFLTLLQTIRQKSEKYYQKGKFVNMSNYISALKCIAQSFDNQTGRVILFTSLDPRSPPCALRLRNQQQQKFPLKPLTSQYAQFARQLITNRIGVDHYIFSKQVLISHQIATSHFIASQTGGNISLYAPYNPQNHSQHLYYSIFKNITKEYVYDVDYTCRISNGLSIGQFLVADGSREVRDIGVSMMDPSNSIAITFTHQQKIQDIGGAYLQFAMMYSTGNGQRKIRIINYKYQLSEKLEAIYQKCDYTAFANILCRIYLCKMKTNDPLKIRQEMINKLAAIMVEFRNECPSLIKYNELNIHPHLSTALSYIHSIFNSKIVLGHNKVSPDFRINQILKTTTLGFYQFALRYYPQVYPITMDIYQTEPLPGDFFPNDQEITTIPENLPLTRSSFKEDGVYLYNTAEYLIIIVMRSAPEELLIDLFGTVDWKEIQQNGLPQLESSHNIRVNNIIGQLRRRNTLYNGIYQPLLVRTPLKAGPFSELVNSIFRQDYPDYNYLSFLEYLHTVVHNKTK